MNTVDLQTFQQLLDSGFIPAANSAHPTALDILDQLPGALLSKNSTGDWTCKITVTQYWQIENTDPDPHKAAAMTFIQLKSL